MVTLTPVREPRGRKPLSLDDKKQQIHFSIETHLIKKMVNDAERLNVRISDIAYAIVKQHYEKK